MYQKLYTHKQTKKLKTVSFPGAHFFLFIFHNVSLSSWHKALSLMQHFLSDIYVSGYLQGLSVSLFPLFLLSWRLKSLLYQSFCLNVLQNIK